MSDVFTSSAAQRALEEGDEEGRGTPLVPESYAAQHSVLHAKNARRTPTLRPLRYFGGDGSSSSVFLYAKSGPLAKNAEAGGKKFVFRDPFVAEKEGAGGGGKGRKASSKQ